MLSKRLDKQASMILSGRPDTQADRPSPITRHQHRLRAGIYEKRRTIQPRATTRGFFSPAPKSTTAHAQSTQCPTPLSGFSSVNHNVRQPIKEARFRTGRVASARRSINGS